MKAVSPPWVRGLFAAAVVATLGAPVAVDGIGWLMQRPGGGIPAALDGELMDAAAPEFELPGLDGEVLRLSALRGEVVLLHFWATWCPPCVEEIPELDALHQALGPEGLVIVAASVDDHAEEVRRFLGDQPPGFRVVMDEGARAAETYGTFKYPETFLIDADGRLRARFVGPRAWSSSEARDYVRSLLPSR